MKTFWDGETYQMAFSPEEKARLVAYYRDPDIRWLETGTLVASGGSLPSEGYYVLAHCLRVECCRPAGPFASLDEARKWSRKNWLPKAENAPQAP
jgi:hypothetical protein